MTRGLNWGIIQMGFERGLSYSLYNRYSFGSLLLNGFYNTAMYSISQDPLYFSSCYADLDSPSGFSSVIDGGRAINNSYYNNGFTGYTIGGFLPVVECTPYSFTGYSSPLGLGLGLGFGGYGGCLYC
ncbi:hypothetical protein J6O48_09825 [bacterium]|nr:hypothetical protein [bacterium]